MTAENERGSFETVRYPDGKSGPSWLLCEDPVPVCSLRYLKKPSADIRALIRAQTKILPPSINAQA